MTGKGRKSAQAKRATRTRTVAAEVAPKRPKKAEPQIHAPQAAEPTRPQPSASSSASPPARTVTVADLMRSQTRESLDALSRNLAEAMTRANGVFSRAFHDQSQGANAPFRADPFDVQGATNRLWADLAGKPETLRDAHGDLWRRYAEIWRNHAARYFAGPELQPPVTPIRDRRFKDPEWQADPFFSMMRETYLATAGWISDLVDKADGVDEATKRKAAFFVKQAVDAASPSNFLLTNPAVLRATLQTSGENLLKGLENLGEDLSRGGGHLNIKQTDLNAFELGKNIATTPGKVIFRNDYFELIHYTPTTPQAFETPLLVFPPWINKFYIMDLQPKNSMIKWILDQGHSVYLVSWANPDESFAERTFEDYMQGGILEAVKAVLDASGAKQVNTIGYCIGGTLLASTLGYMAAKKDRRIQSATFLASQMDFEKAGELLIFTDTPSLRYLAERMEAKGGVLDAQAMADTFNSLRSNDLIWNYVVDNYYLGNQPPPFDLLYWNADQTRMPRALHLFYLETFYQNNKLARGELHLLGQKIDLGKVTASIYMQSAKEDHIAPFPSVYRSAKLFGGPVEFMMAGSGHIAGVINHPAANKYQYWTNPKLPDTVEDWQAGAVETAGSWWPHWIAWLSAQSGPKIPARAPGANGEKVLGDAPGEYVRVRSFA